MTKSTITRESITHDLKIYPEFFSAVCTGVKRAELRKNDRDYRVGDTLHLMETPRGSCHRTGEFINVTITHIADVGEWMPGYVLLSVELQERRKADSEPVAWTDEEELRDVNVAGIGYLFGIDREANKFADPRRQIMLYRHAQPAPVVPDAATAIRACLSEFPESARDIVEECADISENACRAAMLQAKSLTSINNAPALVSLQKKAESIIGNYPGIPDCWCRTCRPVVLNDMRFVVCPDCGNKRCPRANDHRNACTGSNEPGQEGSTYPDTPREVK